MKRCRESMVPVPTPCASARHGARVSSARGSSRLLRDDAGEMLAGICPCRSLPVNSPSSFVLSENGPLEVGSRSITAHQQCRFNALPLDVLDGPFSSAGGWRSFAASQMSVVGNTYGRKRGRCGLNAKAVFAPRTRRRATLSTGSAKLV